MKNSLLIISIFITVFVFTVPLNAVAQGGPPATPIDGGLSLLLAGGVAYGVKKIRDNRLKQDK